MSSFKANKISKSDFFKIDEGNLMFITNPGRMGDEDGTTFIIKNGIDFVIYRVDGWMYRKPGEKVDISMEDMIKQFPMWFDAWKHSEDKDCNSKYYYIYMGFGNGLCVDNSIYDEFKPYLNELVGSYFERHKDEDKDVLKYAAVFDVWEEAFINMADDRGYVLKNDYRRK